MRTIERGAWVTLYLPFVALAMHQRVDAPIEQIVLGAEAADPIRTLAVVLATASVSLGVAAHLHVTLGQRSFAAVLGARHYEHTREIATSSGNSGVN